MSLPRIYNPKGSKKYKKLVVLLHLARAEKKEKDITFYLECINKECR